MLAGREGGLHPESGQPAGGSEGSWDLAGLESPSAASGRPAAAAVEVAAAAAIVGALSSG